MAKDKTKETPAAVDHDSRGEMKQFKIYLGENDIKNLKKISAAEGITGATKARMIIIQFLDSLKNK